MTEHIPKKLLWAGVAVLPPLLALFAYTRPGYFTSRRTYVDDDVAPVRRRRRVIDEDIV